jgi:hypothetical protein
LKPLFKNLDSEEKVIMSIFGKLPPFDIKTPDPVIIAFMQQFTKGYSTSVIWTLLNTFYIRLPFTFLHEHVEYIIKTFKMYTPTHFLDEPTSKIGIGYLSKHTYMIPAHTLSVTTPQICWKNMKPGGRALILAFALIEKKRDRN